MKDEDCEILQLWDYENEHYENENHGQFTDFPIS